MNHFSRHLRPLLVCAAGLALTGCIGMGAKFSSPASDSEVPYTVVPINGNLVSRMAAARSQLSTEIDADASANVQSVLPSSEMPYQIGVNDVLSLDIFGLPEKLSSGAGTNLYVVQEDGTVIMPYAGTVKVADLTLAAARERIMAGMRRYIDSPQFNFRIVEYRSRRLLVAGTVGRPGYQFLSAEPATLVDVITAAGGPAVDADLSAIVVQRGDKRVTVDLSDAYAKGDLSKIPRMQHGDVVRVGKRNVERVYVSGAVQNVSVQEIIPNKTSLSDVLFRAGGIQQGSSDSSEVYVIRGTPANATVFHLNASTPEALVLASNFPIEPQDVVFVSEHELVRLGRILGLLLAPVSGAVNLGTTAQTLGNGGNR